MGNVLAPITALALTRNLRRPDRENPTLAHIQAHHEAEQARERAEQAAREALEELTQYIQWKADQDWEQVRVRQEEANQAAAQAAEEVERMRAQIEEAVNAERRAQVLTEVAAKLAREAEEERKRSQRMREDAEGAMTAAKEVAERAQKAADEQRREAEAGKTRVEEASCKAAEEAKKVKEAEEEAERRLKKGIQSVVIPTPEQLAAAKRRIEYREDCFHFAVAGISGSGKSSLVNAFRGLRSREAGAAAVGVTETTLQLTRYPGTNPENPFVWYDTPGAGTLKCRDWQYLNDQGLYVFDCIIVLFDNRFTMTDVAILVNARRFNIPTYVVRSKADRHIRYIMMEMGYDSEEDDEEDVERRETLYKAARKHFIDQTRESVETNLKNANLPNQRVYIVSNSTMLNIVLDRMPKKRIDEVDLLIDLFSEANRRRRTTIPARIGCESGAKE